MLSVADALDIVLRHCRQLPAVAGTLTPESVGLVLAEDVRSDLDMPPFDKALMDGYAIRCQDLIDGAAELEVQAEVMAGQSAPPLRPKHAIRIMTGAPIPAGAEAVIPVEDTRNRADNRVEFRTRQPRPVQHILQQGREMKSGEVVLAAGTLLGPQEIGLLATVGQKTTRVIPRPTLAILATGDELVDASAKPGPAQLRNSNGPMLAEQASRAGAIPRTLGIARDTVEDLRTHIQAGLQASILMLSGGVSAGKLDLVPGVLQDLGVTPHFHKVAMKPGKPLFFGTRGDTLVFGLPGNPVGAYCSFELFVRPAIRKLSGHTDPGPAWTMANLRESVNYSNDRPTYHPAKLFHAEGFNRVQMVPWFGSPDLRGLTLANALLLLPAGAHSHQAGTLMSVLPLDG